MAGQNAPNPLLVELVEIDISLLSALAMAPQRRIWRHHGNIPAQPRQVFGDVPGPDAGDGRGRRKGVRQKEELRTPVGGLLMASLDHSEAPSLACRML
jgi:hypothetical protein